MSSKFRHIFIEIFCDSDDESGVKPTWAAVVRSGNGEMDSQRKRVRDMEVRLTAENQKKDKELMLAEEKRIERDLVRAAEEAEKENQIKEALNKAAADAAAAIHSAPDAEEIGGGGGF